MFGLNAGYVDALVKADTVRFNLSSLNGVRSDSSHKENIGTPANGRDWFEARWYFEPAATLAQVHAMVGTFSNLGAAERFNFEPFVTLAYTHATLGNWSSLSVMAIFNQADHLRGARGTQIGSALLQGAIQLMDASIPTNFMKTHVKSDREFTAKGSGALVMLTKS